ncbi:MAG: alpha/beta hydrolase [Candidatus Woesearchaeota archaeon]
MQFKSIKVKNDKGLNLDVNIYFPVVTSSKFIIFSIAFIRYIDYNLAYREFAKQAAKEGYNVILYSYTGLGNSEGTFSEIDLFDQRNDLQTIINFVRNEKQDAKICLAGISIGGTTSILAYAQAVESGFDDIKVLLTWNSSLQTKGLYARYKDHYSNPNIMTKDHELYITGEHINSGRKMWESFGKIDAIKELKKITIPFFAIFGEEDEPEKSAAIRQILDALPNCSYELLPGVDHELTIHGSQERVIKASLNWLKEHF